MLYQRVKNFTLVALFGLVGFITFREIGLHGVRFNLHKVALNQSSENSKKKEM